MTKTKTTNDRVDYILSAKTGKLKEVAPFDSDDLEYINKQVAKIRELERCCSDDAPNNFFSSRSYAGNAPPICMDSVCAVLNKTFDEVMKVTFKKQIAVLVKELKDEYNFTYTHGNVKSFINTSILEGKSYNDSLTIDIDSVDGSIVFGSDGYKTYLTPERISEIMSAAIEQFKNPIEDDMYDDIPF